MMRDIILKALQEASGEREVKLEFPENEAFGDFSSSVAMVAGKKADEIINKLEKEKTLKGLISEIEAKGPGFINFFLSREALLAELEKIGRQKDSYGRGEKRDETVVVDYSSPNIAKRFSVGHLRSTVIGQALYNLYEFLGYKAIGDNHLGDWGTQFGALLYQVSSIQYPVSGLTLDKLEKLYVEFHQKAEANPKLWDEARSWFKKLEEGDSQARKLWKEMVEISLAEFNRIYDRLGIKIDYAYGESFYQDYLPKVIELVREKGLATKSKGAEIVKFPSTSSGQLPPAMLLKSDGATTYFTRDLATILFRIKSWDPKIIIYEVGSEQKLHFQQVFAAAALLGWAKDRKFVHLGHGLIRFEHGKMSTRKGETVKLEEVLDEAITRARRIIDKSETSRGLSAPEKEEVARVVGIGAVKYFDLAHHPATDIIFDWEKMFVLEGNSAPYLQYTVARTNSVATKVKNQKSKAKMAIRNLKLNNEELAVMRSLVRFPETVKLAAGSFSPNLLANHLFDLAQKYNNFYARHRILGSDNLELRLRLTSAVGQVLKNGLTILGIQTPERM